MRNNSHFQPNFLKNESEALPALAFGGRLARSREDEAVLSSED